MLAAARTRKSAPWIVYAEGEGDGNSDSGGNFPPIPDEDLPF